MKWRQFPNTGHHRSGCSSGCIGWGACVLMGAQERLGKRDGGGRSGACMMGGRGGYFGMKVGVRVACSRGNPGGKGPCISCR